MTSTAAASIACDTRTSEDVAKEFAAASIVYVGKPAVSCHRARIAGPQRGAKVIVAVVVPSPALQRAMPMPACLPRGDDSRNPRGKFPYAR
jgi:hypothetical protein